MGDPVMSVWTKAIAAFLGGTGFSAVVQLILFSFGLVVMDDAAIKVAAGSIATGLMTALTVAMSGANAPVAKTLVRQGVDSDKAAQEVVDAAATITAVKPQIRPGGSSIQSPMVGQ